FTVAFPQQFEERPDQSVKRYALNLPVAMILSYLTTVVRFLSSPDIRLLPTVHRPYHQKSSGYHPPDDFPASHRGHWSVDVRPRFAAALQVAALDFLSCCHDYSR